MLFCTHKALRFGINTGIRLKSKGSSHLWLERQNKDIYVKKAKEDGYLCRSAYKLLELDRKYRLFFPGCSVVDCGAAPGSWTQVAVAKTANIQGNRSFSPRSGIVVSVDLQEMQPINGAVMLGKHDFTKESTKKKVKEFLGDGLADVVLSDMAPSASGNRQMDHDRIMDLSYDFFEFAQLVLVSHGSAICKIWEGPQTQFLLNDLQRNFARVSLFKPKSSRTESSEIYVCALERKEV